MPVRNVKAPHVKILMITYNHEDYIEKAIRGVLGQETPFPYFLVLGEDCSTDRTRSICEKYASEFPDQITLLPSNENLGAIANASRTRKACLDADYVAFCDGDDVWTDKKKLAHQVRFLEENHNFIAHSHNVVRRDVISNVDSSFGNTMDGKVSKESAFLGWPFHVSSLVVRGEMLRSLPNRVMDRSPSGDMFLARWAVCQGGIFYEGSKFMAIYHRHDFGASGTSDYHELLYQDLEMVNYFASKFGCDECILEAKIKLMRRIALSWAERRGTKKHSAFKLAMNYLKIAPLKERSDYYYLLLILFGRSFYLLRKNLKNWHVSNRFQ